jgi:hypothetical protein
MQGVLTPEIVFSIFGSVSGNLTLPNKWGCNKINQTHYVIPTQA